VTFRESSPVLAHLSTPAAVVGALNGSVYAFDLATGNDEPGWPVTTSDPVNSSPAAADVLGTGEDQIFVGSGEAAQTVAGACSGGGAYAFKSGGAVLWHNIGSDADCANQAFHSSFAIGDVTGNGQPDATIGALGLQSPSYTAASGVMNPGWPFFTDDTVFSSPALADVTGSGVPDVIMGGDATAGPGSFRGGMMRAITGAGHLLWEFKVDEQVRSSPAIGTIDGSGQPSIVFGTGNFWQENGGATDSTSIFSLTTTGQLKWRKDLGGDTLAGPALADVLGTGQPDIIEGTAGTPASPNTGLIWVLDGNGNPLPGWGGVTSPGGVVIGSISTADLSGDGAQDLLVPTGAGVFIYDGRTAQQVAALDVGLVGFQNTPLVTDDGGASVGITIAGTQPDGTGVVQHWRVAGGQLGAIGWPMFHHDPQHTGNLASIAAPTACAPLPQSPPPTGAVRRLDGANRDATAVAVSQASFPSTGSAAAVVLASDAGYPDALAGTPLAVSKHAPLLLTPPSGLTPTVSAEISRAAPRGSPVYVLGGDAALSSSIDGQIQALGDNPQRVAGSDRFATAVAIAGALGDPNVILEASGLDFPDALSAGAAASKAAGAVLLTAASSQAPETAAYLEAHTSATRTAVGGPAAAADPGALALAGSDRFATAVMVAQHFFPSPRILGFASGSTFPDALSGGANIGEQGGPMLLVPACGSLPSALSSYLRSVHASITGGSLYGGPLAVGDDVLAQLDKAA